jgi:hypothetical protein
MARNGVTEVTMISAFGRALYLHLPVLGSCNQQITARLTATTYAGVLPISASCMPH